MKVLQVIALTASAAGLLTLAACASNRQPPPAPAPAPAPMDGGGYYTPSK